MNKRPRPAVLALMASTVLLVIAAIGFAVAGSPFGGDTISSIGDRHSPAASASATPTPGPGITKDPRPVPVPVPTADPVRLRIPDLGIEANVIPVGVDSSNAMEIPEDIMEVGWYRFGPAPGGSSGSAVLVAHRDGRVQGHGVFYSLGALNLDDPIFVTDDTGKRLEYRVIARESIPKKKLPIDDVFATDGSPRLTLITCGGYYDRSNGGYQDNVVVTAVPASVSS